MYKIPENARPIGYKALVDKYKLSTITHYRWSYIIATGGRQIHHHNNYEIHLYPKGYGLSDEHNDLNQLIFALKYDGINLAILTSFFSHITTHTLETYLQKTPTGKYTRIIWYLYELLTEKKLSLEDIKHGSYCNLLDPLKYYTAQPRPIRRQRVNDNMLGDVTFCPFVRRTQVIARFEEKHFHTMIRSLISTFDQHLISRAMHYLYTKETMSSYQIERERPDKKRIARFTQLLRQVDQLAELDEHTLTKLQNAIVDERFADSKYRKDQNYIGKHVDFTDPTIHYIAPKPEDVPVLMQGLLTSMHIMINTEIHPVIIAGIISFGFVFIHPFQDGNGRISRFLIHYILSRLGFTPGGTIFPVSAVMLENMRDYDRVLEDFSIPLMSKINNYRFDNQGHLQVNNDTFDYYAYLDYTSTVEFLFACIEKTIENNFKNELYYLLKYDKAKKKIQNIVDMPDRLIDLFIRLSTQTDGTLSPKKRKKFFSMLTDKEIKEIEQIIKRYFEINS